MAQSVVTLASVEAAHARGAPIPLGPGAIVTPLARDAARRLGVELRADRGGRARLCLANWKANGRAAEARGRAAAIARGALALPAGSSALAIFPPAPHLGVVEAALAEVVDGAGRPAVALGAQDLSLAAPGAATGEVPASMLVDLGCRYALVGHSERRQSFGDTEAVVRQKLARALAAGLTPVLCVGETLDEREAGRTFAVLRRQLLDAVEGLKPADAGRLVIAYEPVWAIGTGLTPLSREVEAALGSLRDHLARRFDDQRALEVPLLYGGSVTPENAAGLLSLPSCDGALVGGASLAPESFLAIARAR